MNPSSIIEAIGYLGSALVLISFLMSSVVKLRVVNAVGSAVFAAYALIIHSYPTALMNICLVLINLRFLWKLRNKEPNYSLVSLNPEESFARFFLERYGKDIAACFPDRRWDAAGLNRAYMVCHGSEPAGLLLGEEKDGVLNIALDYSTPVFRDSSVGHYLMAHLPGEGLRLLRYEQAEPSHVGYLEKMGFQQKGGAYEKSLTSA